MLTFMIPTENMRRRGIVEPYLEMMDEHLKNYTSIQSIVIDYGSTDDTKEIVKQHKSEYMYVEPNEGESCNLPKCFNRGILRAKNDLIVPINIDFTFEGDLIEGITKYFLKQYNMILRIQIQKPDKENIFSSVTYAPYVVNKRHVIMVGGWDERIWGWGKDDDDIIERIKREGKVPEVKASGFKYNHIWHEPDWWAESEKIRPNKNIKFLTDNRDNRSRNAVNTAWSRTIDAKNGSIIVKVK